MNQYEIGLLFDPGLEVDIEKATSRVEKIFKDNGAKISKVDNWGKKKLAYVIKKHDHAIYIFYTLDIPPLSVIKIEKVLNITEEVLRFIIVRPDLKKMARAEAAITERKKKQAERVNPNSSDSEKSSPKKSEVSESDV
ncbi:MAG: 30S ribosomal protein S6 [Candidatus Saccharibacteria bacterium]|jgi:small subunit ribosomal protein S6